jgi:hypothetical protein
VRHRVRCNRTFSGSNLQPFNQHERNQHKMKSLHHKIAQQLKNLLQRKAEIGEPLPVIPETRAREIMGQDKTLTASQAVAKAREESDAAITASMELEQLDGQIVDVCQQLGEALQPLKNQRSEQANSIYAKALNRWLNGDGKAILDEQCRAFVFALTKDADEALAAANHSAAVPQIFVGSKSGVNWKSWRVVRPTWQGLKTHGRGFDSVDGICGGGDDDSLQQLAEHCLSL